MEIFAQQNPVRRRAGRYLDTGLDYYFRPRTSPIFSESLNHEIDYYNTIEQNGSHIESIIMQKYKKVNKILNNTKKANPAIFDDLSIKSK